MSFRFNFEIVWEESFPCDKFNELFDDTLYPGKDYDINTLLSDSLGASKQKRGRVAEKIVQTILKKHFRVFSWKDEIRNIDIQNFYELPWSFISDVKSLVLLTYIANNNELEILDSEGTKKKNLSELFNNPKPWPEYLKIECVNRRCFGRLDFKNDKNTLLECTDCSVSIKLMDVLPENILYLEPEDNSLYGRTRTFRTFSKIEEGFLKPNQVELFFCPLIVNISEDKWNNQRKKKLERMSRYREITGKEHITADTNDIIEIISENEKNLQDLLLNIKLALNRRERIWKLKLSLKKDLFELYRGKNSAIFDIELDFWAISKDKEGFGLKFEHPIYAIDSKSYLMKSCNEHNKRPKFKLEQNQKEFIAEVIQREIPSGIFIVTVGFCQCKQFFVKIVKPMLQKSEEGEMYFKEKDFRFLETYVFLKEKLEVSKDILQVHNMDSLLERVESLQQSITNLHKLMLSDIHKQDILFEH